MFTGLSDVFSLPTGTVWRTRCTSCSVDRIQWRLVKRAWSKCLCPDSTECCPVRQYSFYFKEQRSPRRGRLVMSKNSVRRVVVSKFFYVFLLFLNGLLSALHSGRGGATKTSPFYGLPPCKNFHFLWPDPVHGAHCGCAQVYLECGGRAMQRQW